MPILLLALHAPLGAQQGAAASYWAQLEMATSVDQVHRVIAPPGVDTVVVDGLLRLRTYELNQDRTLALVARTALERAAPAGSAATHFALGVALARGPDVRVRAGDAPEAYFVDANSNAARMAPRSLKRALELDPGMHEAAFVLAELALDLGDRPLMGDALRYLEQPSRARLARSQQLRARLLTALDELVGAAHAADSAAALGLDPSVAAHLKAAALLRRRGSPAEAEAAYFDGVAQLTEASAEVYFRALAPILSPGELQRWRELDHAGRREWLVRFWDVQAALAGVPTGQRLAIHYLRLAELERNGRVRPMGAAGALDARGLEEVWALREYGISSLRDLLLVRHGDVQRAQRVRFCGKEVLDIPLPLAPTPAQCARSPISRMRESNAAYVGGLGVVAHRAGVTAVPGSTYYPPFSRHLELVHEVLQFRGPVGQTTLVASVGMPTSSARQLVSDGVMTALVELSLIDTANTSVIRQDSLRRFRVGTLPANGTVLLTSELSMPPRALLYRIGIMDPARTVGRVAGGTVEARAYDSGDLQLSDVLATPEDGVPSFARGAVRLSLAPGREFSRDENFTLYYEVYGLAEGAAYRTEIRIEPKLDGITERVRALFPGAREAVMLTFDEVVDTAHVVFGVQERRSVGLGGLVPGAYDLTIAVTDGAGRTATRTRALYVAGPRE
ncbi:MAG TPA: hypothetical protein VK928_07965 [Longimicrobiales bacterium]|nr:hypothetical protein [Longimicrobiales bacterium]